MTFMVSLALSAARTIATARLNRKEGSSETDVLNFFSTPFTTETHVSRHSEWPEVHREPAQYCKAFGNCYWNGVRFDDSFITVCLFMIYFQCVLSNLQPIEL